VHRIVKNMDEPDARGGRAVAAICFLAGTLVLSACAGENLFSLTAGAGAAGATVDITAPGEGFTVALGDSVLVLTDVTAPDRATLVTYRGTHPDTGDDAYIGQTETLGNVPAATLQTYLKAADTQVSGSAYVVVEVTDALGQTGIDSVKVSIAN
jgi:hypothetical protein